MGQSFTPSSVMSVLGWASSALSVTISVNSTRLLYDSHPRGF